MNIAQPHAAAFAKLPSASASTFAITQAAWRFLNNDRVTLPDLMQPIREAGAKAARQSQSEYILAVHDWSKISCGHHRAKKDVARLTHQHDVGYELYSCLMVEAQQGLPLAPMEFHLKTANAVYHGYDSEPADDQWHIDQLDHVMSAIHSWDVEQRVVHVIDQEADSVAHYRRWDAREELFLVRSEDRRVLWRDKPRKLSSIVRTLLQEKAFEEQQMVPFRGRQHQLRVARTDVVLHRCAKTRVGGKQVDVPGVPLPLRLVVSRVYDEQNRKKGEWFLLTNTPSEVSGLQIANWYYWRWRIESFFKLLKSSGFELEHWQQASGAAFARRLLVASMCCVMVWQLERDTSSRSTELKKVLIRMSGRQMKRSRPYTAPALLAGLEKLLMLLAITQEHSVAELWELAQQVLPAQLLNSS